MLIELKIVQIGRHTGKGGENAAGNWFCASPPTAGVRSATTHAPPHLRVTLEYNRCYKKILWGTMESCAWSCGSFSAPAGMPHLQRWVLFFCFRFFFLFSSRHPRWVFVRSVLMHTVQNSERCRSEGGVLYPESCADEADSQKERRHELANAPAPHPRSKEARGL